MMKNRHGKRGGSLAETAIVMTVMLLFLFAIIDFGRALYTYTFLTNVAQKATRWAIVRGSNCSILDHCGANADNTYIASWILTQDVGIVNPSLMNISGDYGLGNCKGCLVVVYITYPFTFLPFVLPHTTVNFRVAARLHIDN